MVRSFPRRRAIECLKPKPLTCISPDSDRLNYFQYVSKATYDDTSMCLKVSLAKTWWVRFDFEVYHYNKLYRITKAVPKSVVATLVSTRPEFEFLGNIAKISFCFERASGMIIPPVKLFLAKKMYLSETLNRVRGTISSVGPVYSFVRVSFEGQEDDELMQVRAVFRCVFDDASFDGVYLLGRWCERLSSVDRTQQQILKWEVPPDKMDFVDGSFFQFISIETVLETVTVVAKPRVGDRHDTFCIADDDRLMWVHKWGRSTQGEV